MSNITPNPDGANGTGEPAAETKAGRYKTLLLNIGLFALNTLSTRLITFFLIPFYTFYLSARIYGITDMAMTTILLAMPILTLSTWDGSLRFSLDEPLKRNYYLTISFVMSLASIAVAAALLPFLDAPIFGGLGEYKWYFLAEYATTAFLNYGGMAARVLNQIKLITWDSIITSVVNVALSLLLIAGPPALSVDGYFLAIIGGNLVGVAIYFIFGRHYRYLQRLPHNTLRKLIKPLLAYSIPLIPNSIFWWVNNDISRFFLTAILGIGASGIYAAASKIPNVLNMLYYIFHQAWVLSIFREKKTKDINAFFSSMFVVLNAGLIVASSAIIALSPQLASFMLQKGFYRAWVFIPPLMVAFYFSTLANYFGSLYTASINTRFLFVSTGVGAALSVVFIWPFTLWWGILGTCLGMALSNAAIPLMRIIHSHIVMHLNLRYTPFILAVVLLSIQATLRCLVPAGGLPISLVLFLALAALEIHEALPYAKSTLQLLRSASAHHRSEKESESTEK